MNKRFNVVHHYYYYYYYYMKSFVHSEFEGNKSLGGKRQ